jgi:hypothetical protein
MPRLGSDQKNMKQEAQNSLICVKCPHPTKVGWPATRFGRANLCSTRCGPEPKSHGIRRFSHCSIVSNQFATRAPIVQRQAFSKQMRGGAHDHRRAGFSICQRVYLSFGRGDRDDLFCRSSAIRCFAQPERAFERSSFPRTAIDRQRGCAATLSRPNPAGISGDFARLGQLRSFVVPADNRCHKMKAVDQMKSNKKPEDAADHRPE